MRRFAPALVVAALTFCACSDGKSGGEPDAGSDLSEPVATTLAGLVLDDADGRPLAGVELRAHGERATTGADGAFAFEVRATRSRCALVARKDGYFVAGKAAQPVADGTTRFVLRLVKKAPQLVEPSGGTVAMPGGAEVAFQAASFARRGQALDETVEVSARHLDPTAADFDRQFPGDLRATREDGSGAMMVSFGVIQVELDDALGEPVELDAARPATLTFPVPPSMQDQAPATMPLWYFDEEAAIWQEQGVLTLDGDRYVGQVAHFTPWNADLAEDGALVTGVVTCGGEPQGGVRVLAGPNTGFTDAQGRFLIEVPANARLPVRVDDELARSGATKLAGPIPPQETEDVGTLALDVCPAGYTGRAVDPEGEPRRAVVRVAWGGGATVTTTGPDGRFRVEVPASTKVTITATSEGGEASTTVTKTTPGSGEEQDLGDLVIGGAPGCDFWDIASEPFAVALSPDGARLAIGLYNQKGVELRDARTGAVERALAPGWNDVLQFSGDGQRLLTGGSYGLAPEVWDAASGDRLQEWTADLQSSLLLPGGTALLGRSLDAGKVEEYAVADGAVRRSFGYGVQGTGEELMGLRAAGRQFLVLRTASGVAGVAAWDLDADTAGASFEVGEMRPFGGATYALSADGETVAFARPGAGEAGVVFDFFATATGHRINAEPFRGPVPTFAPEHLALGPDGGAFATQSSLEGGKLDLPRLFSLPGLELVRTLPWEPSARVNAFVFSADGRYLAMVEYGRKVRMVDLTSCP